MNYNKPFQKSEYDQRVRKVKLRMEKAGFDLLICQDPVSYTHLRAHETPEHRGLRRMR